MLIDKEARRGRREGATEKAVGIKSNAATALTWQYE
jgi:hypothetical protein